MFAPGPRAWRLHAFAIQLFSDGFDAQSGSVKRENSANDGRLFGIDAQLSARNHRSAILVAARRIFDRHGLVAENVTAVMATAQHATFDSAKGFFAQLFDVRRVCNAMHGHQDVALLAIAIESLRHKHEAHAGELQAIGKQKRVGKFP